MIKKMKILSIIITFSIISCSINKRVENYRVIDGQIEVYRYSNKNEPKRDILSNGDTLISTLDTIYIVRKM